MILDCENFESALSSAANLFGCSEASLVRLLSEVDLAILAKAEPLVDPVELLYRYCVTSFGEPANPEFVHWFHLTRTNHENRFFNGILPLDRALEQVWDTILQAFESTVHYSRLQRMKDEGVNEFQFKLKTQDRMHWGPYAMLVKEAAFRAKEMPVHDYLRLPEIIEDICNAYHGKYKVFLQDELAQCLTPCIVKFQSTNGVEDELLNPTIWYLYLKITEQPLSIYGNTCFDGKRGVVPPEDILDIEFIDIPY